MQKLNVLLVTDSWKDYIAKVWWSIHKGLTSQCNLYTFGKDQEYNGKVKTYEEIISLLPITDIDILITNFKNDNFLYEGIEKLKCKKAVIVGDYWSLHPGFFYNISPKVDYIFSFFSEFVEKMQSSKVLFLPPSVDTDIFKDWKEIKEYIVGFLGAGCTTKDDNYPERYIITNILKDYLDDDFYSPSYPGWGYFKDEVSLVGANFSKAINRCKMIVNTSGIIGHCNPKYVEFAASGSMLLAGKCHRLDKLYFKDGFNCVEFNTNNDLIDKISYYHFNDKERVQIIQNALDTIDKYHTSEIRAKEILEMMK